MKGSIHKAKALQILLVVVNLKRRAICISIIICIEWGYCSIFKLVVVFVPVVSHVPMWSGGAAITNIVGDVCQQIRLTQRKQDRADTRLGLGRLPCERIARGRVWHRLQIDVRGGPCIYLF